MLAKDAATSFHFFATQFSTSKQVEEILDTSVGDKILEVKIVFSPYFCRLGIAEPITFSS